MSLSQRVHNTIDEAIRGFIQEIANKYGIEKEELLSMWSGSTPTGVSKVAAVATQASEANAGARTELMKMKKPELQTLCKEKGLKHTGTKPELVALLLGEGAPAPASPTKKAQQPKKTAPAPAQEPPPVMKKISASVPTIAIRRNQFNNYEHRRLV